MYIRFLINKIGIEYKENWKIRMDPIANKKYIYTSNKSKQKVLFFR